MIRLLDLLLSCVAVLVLLPFMIPVMLGLKMTGEHHIIYLQTRVGKGGRDFKVIKFATMLKDSPNLPGGCITQQDDPRVLPLGGFLRKTKCNELPQLVNIILGQMSFVGPRPVVRRHVELHSEEVRAALLSITPGLTGIGSVVFRDEEGILDRCGKDRKHFHDTVITSYKGDLEVWFTKHRTVRTWLVLIALTAWAVVRPSSKAYRKVFRDLPVPAGEIEGHL